MCRKGKGTAGWRSRFSASRTSAAGSGIDCGAPLPLYEAKLGTSSAIEKAKGNRAERGGNRRRGRGKDGQEGETAERGQSRPSSRAESSGHHHHPPHSLLSQGPSLREPQSNANRNILRETQNPPSTHTARLRRAAGPRGENSFSYIQTTGGFVVSPAELGLAAAASPRSGRMMEVLSRQHRADCQA